MVKGPSHTEKAQRGQGSESPPVQSFAKMQTLVLAEPHDYTAESVLAPTQRSLLKSSAALVRFYSLYTVGNWSTASDGFQAFLARLKPAYRVS